MQTVMLTKKGFFTRRDKGFGLLIFSPFSGLFFAIAEEYADDTENFLNNKPNSLPIDIVKNLNIDYDSSAKSDFEVSHWLPRKDLFKKFPNKKPIVINWLISSKCNLQCKYCYAGDVIDKGFDYVDAKEIATQILFLEPLAVVLSGGEPLLEKNKILEAIDVLGGKTGIILDTNGVIFDDHLVKLLKKHKAVVRISLDSLHNETNSRIRPSRDSAQNSQLLLGIVENILKYRKAGIPVLIHTVVSSVNKNNLDDLYDKLSRFVGINGWRLFSVVKPNDKTRKASFDKLMISGRAKDIVDAQEDIRNKLAIFANSHSSKSTFSLQVVHSTDSSKNSVVLVLPNGKFYTESVFQATKIEIDAKDLFNDVDLKGHCERYLGKIR